MTLPVLDATLTLRLTSDEARSLATIAANKKMRLSAFARMILIKHADKVKAHVKHCKEKNEQLKSRS